MGEADRTPRENGAEQPRETVRGKRPGDRYVRVIKSTELPVSPRSQRYFVAPPTEATSAFGRLYERLHRLLIGRPIESAQAIHERLTKTKALAVFSSDALSSTAYATEEILLILVVAGAAAYRMVIPIGIAIAALLAIVVFSYRQTIHAYPQGGGSYIVTKDNLGRKPSLLAASALLTGYTLTVAVSISAGVAALTSASEALLPYRVWLALGAIVLMMVANLRGVRESGTIFAVPTYLFIGAMVILLALGLGAWAGIGLTPHPVHSPLPAVAAPLTAFVVLRAFAAGCAALTGVEAIADGVPAFKEPQARNAAQTLVWMGVILGTLFLGVTFLTHHFHLAPAADETIVSQLTRTIVGRSPFYYLIQAATALILVLGANTAFADFPRLSYFLARDGFMPHQFMARGDRLAFSTGIVVLGGAAMLLVVSFKAEVSSLIPLYAVGVFVAFTMSQSSMTFRWWRSPRGRQRTLGLAINGLGATTTAVVVLINITTRFLDGAWMVLIILPVVIIVMLGIRRHYDNVAYQLQLSEGEHNAVDRIMIGESAAIVPMSAIDRASLRAIEYARQITSNVTAVHVTDDPDDARQMQERWDELGLDVPLVIIESPYREIVGPLVNYVEQLHRERQDLTITVVLPEFVPAHLYELLLHNQTALRLKFALWTHPDVVVINVPYHLKR
ncbi:MAG TPA: APC family permease [Thermomicrobiaceae bacterium]|nr:APC family permease [Thermomicrobiaceae bacterium]